MKLKFAVTVMAVVTFACGRPDSVNDAGGQCFGLSCPTAGGSAGGSAGGTSAGGGAVSGGGTATGGGAAGGAGGLTGTAITIAEARALPNFPAAALVRGVVVTAVSFGALSVNSTTFCKDKLNPTMDTATKGATASFWVADPANPKSGIFISKERCDSPYDYVPTVGDILDIKGYADTVSPFNDREGKRVNLNSQRARIPRAMRPPITGCSLLETTPCQPLEIFKSGTRAPLAANDVTSDFGADGGVKAERSYLGSQIKMAGPLTISDINPPELKRISLVANDDRYFGFRLSNGVLVGNYKTFSDTDAGRCDYRRVVADGGMVSFSSITGMWDSYVHAVCVDGGIESGCFANSGILPGSDAGLAHILYPMDCADYVTP
jgi:hypothetical protein